MSRFAFLLLVVLTLSLPTAVAAQSTIHEKDLIGSTWKMDVELDTKGKNALERIALAAAGGMLDDVDIRFSFHEENVLTVSVNIFGEEEEDETTDWYIDAEGGLILGETDTFESNDTVWMLEDGDLVAHDRDGGADDTQVKLKRVR